MTSMQRLIMLAVALGGRKVHPRYLPEVLALVCQRKLYLVDARADIIIVERV